MTRRVPSGALVLWIVLIHFGPPCCCFGGQIGANYLSMYNPRGGASEPPPTTLEQVGAMLYLVAVIAVIVAAVKGIRARAAFVVMTAIGASGLGLRVVAGRDSLLPLIIYAAFIAPALFALPKSAASELQESRESRE